MKRKKNISMILLMAFSVVFGFQSMTAFAENNWHSGAKINFTPAIYDKQYDVPYYVCENLEDLGLEAYEDLYEDNNRWNVFVGPLRAYQDYLKSNDKQTLTSNGASISNFVDSGTLEPNKAKSEAEVLVRLGVLTGIEEDDGTYMYMKNQVKRGEVAKILAVFYQKLFPDFRPIRSTHYFDDTYDHWAKQYIDYCYERNLLNGKSEREFDPEGYITKAESIRLLCNMVNLENGITASNVAKAINETYMCTTAYDEQSNSTSNSQYSSNLAITPNKWYYTVSQNSTVDIVVKGNSSYSRLSIKEVNNNIKITKNTSSSGKYEITVKGLYEGVGFIECKYSNTSSENYRTLYIPIFVKGNSLVQAKNITVRNTTLNLDVGGSYLLSSDVTVTPSSANYNGIYFSSTDPDVASVNYLTGQVTARSNGTCYIYVMTYNTSKKVQVKVSGYNGNYSNNYNYGTNYLNLSVNVGKTLNLKNYISTSSYNVSYYSNNTSIASVTSKGVITGKKVGNTQITVNDGNTRYIVNIAVLSNNNYNNNYYDDVQDILLNFNEIDISVEQDYDMFDNVYFYPTYADISSVRFSSENSSIAKVGSKTGIVTGISEGATRIKIYYGNITRYCTVFVDDNNNNSTNIAVKDININLKNNSLSLFLDDTYYLENDISVYPTNATNVKIYYSSDNTDVVKVSSSGKLTAISKGTATITVRAGNIEKYVYITVYENQNLPNTDSSKTNIQFLSNSQVQIGVGLDFNPYSILNVTSGVTFTLSDYSIAKIENNRVIGISKGTVILTATYNGSSDTIQILVN